MSVQIIQGNALALPLADETVDLIVTSPPYFGLRSYQDGGEHYGGQIGSEPTPAEFLDALIAATREMVRVLKPSGSIFVNLGDKYSTGSSGQSGMAKLGEQYRGGGHTQEKAKVRRAAVSGMPPKSLLLIPERYRIRAVDELGLIARAVIIWSKPNGLPESVTDRVRRSHEDWVHLTKRPRYYSAVDEIREEYGTDFGVKGSVRVGAYSPSTSTGYNHNESKTPNALGKLPGSVWTIPTQPLTVPPHLGVDHFAAYPMEWPRRIIAGWSPRDICTVCGEGRRPVSDVTLTHNRKGRTSQRAMGTPISGGEGNQTLGWERTVAITGYVCACKAPTITQTIREFDYETDEMVTRDVQIPDPAWVNPAPTTPSIILDPFGGTGTTALVAHALGRHGISVDMSADYCRLARWRTTDPGELARARQVDKPAPQVEGQADLFTLIGEGA